MRESKPDCPCKRERCSRHGDCEACRAHHASREHKPMTACERIRRKAERAEARVKRHTTEE